MKHHLTLLLAGLALSGATSFGATLDLANLGGTFATGYTDSTGIPGLKITYTVGDQTFTSENRGYSKEAGRGMSLSDPHLAVGPGDTVTFDFTNVNLAGNEVYVAFIDLDNNAQGGNEDATVIHNGGSIFEPGAPGQILNAEAHNAANIINVGPVVPDGNNLIKVQANSSFDQGALGNGYFALSVSTDVVVPEPSVTLLGLVGLGLFMVRRRRS